MSGWTEIFSYIFMASGLLLASSTKLLAMRGTYKSNTKFPPYRIHDIFAWWIFFSLTFSGFLIFLLDGLFKYEHNYFLWKSIPIADLLLVCYPVLTGIGLVWLLEEDPSGKRMISIDNRFWLFVIFPLMMLLSFGPGNDNYKLPSYKKNDERRIMDKRKVLKLLIEIAAITVLLGGFLYYIFFYIIVPVSPIILTPVFFSVGSQTFGVTTITYW
ncbi:MAG: hypothetical protein ACOC5D_06950 [Thermoplasmatota archaeon]